MQFMDIFIFVEFVERRGQHLLFFVKIKYINFQFLKKKKKFYCLTFQDFQDLAVAVAGWYFSFLIWDFVRKTLYLSSVF